MIVKSDVFYPALFAIAVAVQLGYRLWGKFRAKAVMSKEPAAAKG
jgi:hypothetical protein